jgi:hypothetical protein
MIGKLAAGAAALVLAVPALAVLTALGVGSHTQDCISSAVATLSPADAVIDTAPENPNPVIDTTTSAPDDGAQAAGCLPDLGTGTVDVPADTPVDVATAVHNALAYVGVRTGWAGLCDRLACRAYGYVGSGYVSAKAHWQVMVDHGDAHPGDRCPPLGSFVFFNTGRPYGHVSLVVKADPVGCDPNVIEVTSNGAFDAATGNHGGVYLLSFARLDRMQLGGHGYLGWSDPICIGALLPAGPVPPGPAGR